MKMYREDIEFQLAEAKKVFCKHDWIEATPFDMPGTPDVCAKCGKKRIFHRVKESYYEYEKE